MDSKNPEISVIVLNYNGQKFLKVLLPSLARQSFLNFELIIVDNGSSDDSLDYVAKNYPEIKILKSKINSFSAGNNLGIKHALGKYIFILNNDVELDKYCISELIVTANKSDKNIGMWATKILNFKQRDLIDNTGLLIYPGGTSRGRGRMELDRGQYDNSLDVMCPSGCAGLYRKEMLDEIGLFDEDFKFYVEDSDLGFRARLAGWACKYVPNAKLYHMYSATLGKYSPQKAFLVERNTIWLIIKNYPLKRLLMSNYYTFKRYLYQLFSIIMKKGAAGNFTKEFSNWELFIILNKAWLAAMIGLPKMLIKRRMVNNLKKVSNKKIDSWFNEFGISVKDISLID